MLAFSLVNNHHTRSGFQTSNGRLETVKGIAELRQALLMLLSTQPGERAMSPEFGCPLNRLAFEPNDATTAGMAIRLVSDAIERHEPRAMIDFLDANPNPDDPACLLIELHYRDLRDNSVDSLSLSVPLDAA